MFGTIVVGVDGSGHADRAVQAVSKIAADTGDKVVVFHVVAIRPAKGNTYTTESRDDAQHLVDRYVALQRCVPAFRAKAVPPERGIPARPSGGVAAWARCPSAMTTGHQPHKLFNALHGAQCAPLGRFEGTVVARGQGPQGKGVSPLRRGHLGRAPWVAKG
jgi:hypothetical protein